jgi:hypothetical protein
VWRTWGTQLGTLSKGIEGHKSLLTLKVNVFSEAFGPDNTYLRQLLSNNRLIRVLNEDGNDHTGGGSGYGEITQLISLNQYYRGSADLVVQPTSKRLPLMLAFLSKYAWYDFQRTALLL